MTSPILRYGCRLQLVLLVADSTGGCGRLVELVAAVAPLVVVVVTVQLVVVVAAAELAVPAECPDPPQRPAGQNSWAVSLY